MLEHNNTARAILIRALAGEVQPTAKEAGFIGQMTFDANSPSERQARWLAILAARYAAEGEAAHD